MKSQTKNKITITNRAGVCLIEIEGTIGVPEEWQFDRQDARVATYEKFRQAVERIAAVEAGQVVVDIRSTGGDVNDALLIYEALRGLDAQITTRCFGYTASAATVIAQAADEGCRQIAASALYLIHESSCAAEGNASELEARVELLRKTDSRLSELYAARSGREAADFAALMAENNGQGRWLSPEETLAAGLADRIIDSAAVPEYDADAEEAAQQQAGSRLSDDGSSREGAATGLLRRGERIIDFIARHRSRLLAALGLHSDSRPEVADDINVLHSPTESLAAQDVSAAAASSSAASSAAASASASAVSDTASAAAAAAAVSIAFREGQRAAQPSDTRPVEDPSMSELRRTANERAYDNDANAISHRLVAN